MRLLGFALFLASCAVVGPAHAGTFGCQKADKEAMNHNAKDPTRPGTIGGCGTGQAKIEDFQKNQQTLKNQQIMTGPQRLNGSNSF